MKPKSFISIDLETIDLAKIPEPLKNIIQKILFSHKEIPAASTGYDRYDRTEHDHWVDEPRYEKHEKTF